ncbi:MAG: hypothetical protein KDD36_04510 [Flavobacteriales bacterium]|nr:hypothetical protein [Flavobacteriales bacterium]
MRNLKLIHGKYLVIALAFMFSACRPDLDKTSWDVDVLAPLVKSSLSIEDLLTDTLLQENPDQTISLVYESHLYNFVMDSMFRMKDTTFTYNVKLQSIEMGDRSLQYPITLGQIARETGGTTGAVILASHGNNLAVPPITGISSGDIAIDANSIFESVTLIDGWMDIILDNQLPIDITNLTFELKNQANGTVIALKTFPLVPAGQVVKDSVDLAGKTVYGDLFGKIVNMDSPGSNGVPVPIDTNDALIATILVRDLNPYSATAVFPDQDIVNETQNMVLETANGVELNYLIIREGFVKIDVVSTLQDTLRFDYQIPSATFQGVPFKVQNKIPPAPPGDTSRFSRLYDFKGYRLDLTGQNGDTVNTWYQSLIGRIDSTGNSTTLSLNDSFYVDAGLIGVIPEYGYGYLGQDVFDVGPAITEVDLFDKVTAGTIDLEKIKVNMEVKNSVGMEADVVLKSLKSRNTRTGNEVALSAGIIDSLVTIGRASDHPLTPVIKNINVNGLETLIENLPDEMEYQMRLRINPNTPKPALGAGTDFIYNDHGIEASMNIEMPLSLSANGLTLSDTSDFDLGDKGTETKKIKDGIFTLLVDNSFPFDAALTVELADAGGNVIDTLFKGSPVNSGLLDASLRVSDSRRTKLVLPVSESRMDNLYDATQLFIKVAFTTAGQPNKVKIYSTYRIDFTLVGDFNYRL